MHLGILVAVLHRGLFARSVDFLQNLSAEQISIRNSEGSTRPLALFVMLGLLRAGCAGVIRRLALLCAVLVERVFHFQVHIRCVHLVNDVLSVAVVLGTENLRWCAFDAALRLNKLAERLVTHASLLQSLQELLVESYFCLSIELFVFLE